jgi:hypothetical protein
VNGEINDHNHNDCLVDQILDTSSGHKSSTVRAGGTRLLGVTVIRYHPKQEDVIVAGTSDGNVLIQVDSSSCRQLVQGSLPSSIPCGFSVLVLTRAAVD